MAKAHITTPQGMAVSLEGTPQEITQLVQELERKISRSGPSRRDSAAKAAGRVTITDLIASLIDGGFFKTPRDLGSVKAALAEMGHHYPVTTLSPTMLRQVRRRHLRRMREGKRWVYTR